jgi:CRISPR/Cas system-associated endoribonuclease Cas2
VQCGAFECNLDDKALEGFLGRLEFSMDPATDSSRLYGLCEGCAGQVWLVGRADRYPEPGFCDRLVSKAMIRRDLA